MIREALEYIADLKKPFTQEIDGKTYSDQALREVKPEIDRPAEISLSSLEAVVAAVKTEYKRVKCPLFVSVQAHDEVKVFTTYREDNMQRDSLYWARPVLPSAPPEWNSHEDSMIILNSRYIQNEGSKYLLGLLSSITDENSVTSNDNGLSQSVTVKQGISLAAKTKVKPRVRLRPYRTFLEVEQPESEFLVRLDKGGQIGLLEADGGAWKLEARKNIGDYFRKQLKDLIDEGKVVVVE